MNSPTIRVSDRLCDRCRFLHFRPDPRGFVEEHTDGKGAKYLGFSLHRGPIFHEIKSFRIKDTFPELPALTESSSRCDFCALIKESIMRETTGVRAKRSCLESLEFCIESPRIRPMARSRQEYHPCGLRLACIEMNWTIKHPAGLACAKRPNSMTPDDTCHLDGCSNFKIFTSPDDLSAKYLGIAYDAYNPEALSSHNISTIREHLTECSEKHAMCGSQSTAPPTRLLEISGTANKKKIRLIHTKHPKGGNGVNGHIKYAALSYCWGGANFIKTTRDNLSDHLDDIPKSSLPQGFQDSISVCWQLGIRYLWIDALCIVQGDSADWEQESARMKDVYIGAFLTLVLVSTASPLEEFLERPPQTLQPIKISYPLNPATGPNLTYYIQPPGPGDATKGLWGPDGRAEDFILRSKWGSRGWTFQESYLARRKLYICANQMNLSCKVAAHLEGVRGASNPLDRFSPFADEEKFAQWYAWVWRYTSRDITNLEDKLPAISAMAHERAHKLGDYLAGLWTDDLAAGLLWSAVSFKALRPSPVYRGPSWSWCAYDGAVEYSPRSSSYISCVQLLEKSCTLKNPHDPYGRMSASPPTWIKVQAKLSTIKIRKSTEAPDSTFVEIEVDGYAAEESGASGCLDCEPGDAFEDWKQLIAMRVAEDHDLGVADGILLLREISSAGRTEYRRIGKFSVDKDVGFSNAKDKEIILV